MSAESSQIAQRVKNFVVVAIAAILSIAIILGIQTRSPAASLAEMAEASVPLNTAMANGKPTLIEFYANWCTSCQAMAADIQQLKKDYASRINFVMLNVDNSKWLPEMLNYRVDGIPHFEFLTAESLETGAAIGEVPRTILAENLEALIKRQPLPHTQVSGKISGIDTATNPINTQSDDPRSHGAQVVK
ncbi:MAG: redoxin family protein [Phormidesmis sp. RL_2_1]|nr:redoxin family protein [Phormidesmis sp. RL_2_1]